MLNGGGILPEEDSCVISEVTSDSKEEEAKVLVTNHKSFLLSDLLIIVGK